MTLYAKLWTDILSDEKLMRAARKGAKQLVLLPWIIAFAKKVDDAGRLTVDGEPAEPDDIAAQVPGVSVRQVGAGLKELETIGVLVRDEDSALRFAAWDHRSGAGSKPSDAPESVADRVRRHRLRKRASQSVEQSASANETPYGDGDTSSETPSVTRSETPSVTPSNAGETSYARSREEEEELEKELELEKDSSSSSPARGVAYADLRTRFTSPAHRATLERIASSVPSPDTWIAEMVARVAGMHGPALTLQQLGDAITDYVGNGNLKAPSFRHFRAYLDRSARPAEARAPKGVAGANGAARSSGPTSGNAGRASIVLQTIRELVEEVRQPGQPIRRFIRRARVAELGADVLMAYEAIGGADRILNATAEQIGFVIRDFSQALEAAHATV